MPWFWQSEYRRRVPSDFDMSEKDELYAHLRPDAGADGMARGQIAGFGPRRRGYSLRGLAVAAEAFVAKTETPTSRSI